MTSEKVIDARREGKILGDEIFYTLERYAATQAERGAMINALRIRLEDRMVMKEIYKQAGKNIDTVICEMQKIMDALACGTTDENY